MSIDMKKTLLVMTAIFLACPLQVARSDSHGETAKMKLEQNKAIVRSYMTEVVNTGNLATFDSYFAQDVLFNNAKGFKQQLAGMTQLFRSAFPDYRLIVRDQIAEGDKVVTRVIMHGTHQGVFNGIAPTGKQVEWSGIAIDRIESGKVVEMWHIQNTAALMQQISTAPSAFK